MNGLNENYPAETKASAKQPIKRDTSESCRERASDDLDKAGADMTVNERLILERSAANWNARANLLDRVEKTARERGTEIDSDSDAETDSDADTSAAHEDPAD